MPQAIPLTVGDPIPPLYVRSLSKSRFSLGSVAGRYIVLTFVGSSSVPGALQYHSDLARESWPDDEFACAFTVISDRGDDTGALIERYPGVRVLLDFDHQLANIFGCAVPAATGKQIINLVSWILDPALRVCKVIPVTDLANHLEKLRTAISSLPPPLADVESCAPVLEIQALFEPEFCQELLTYAEAAGLEESGFMNTDPLTGKTVMVNDPRHKRRADTFIDREDLRDGIRVRLQRRLVPQLERAFQFKATRIERYIIACYDGQTAGHFRAHRDNTTMGTAHRRFAVSIGLNTDYDGGELRFPEFGGRTYRPSFGGAVIFSCSLLHEVLPVRAGCRYAVLPFLYDDAAAQLRLENLGHLQDPELRAAVTASIAGEGT